MLLERKNAVVYGAAGSIGGAVDGGHREHQLRRACGLAARYPATTAASLSKAALHPAAACSLSG